MAGGTLHISTRSGLGVFITTSRRSRVKGSLKMTMVAASASECPTAMHADARTARALYALRRVLGGAAGGLRASWRVGGIERRDGLLVHRANLAVADAGQPVVSGGAVAVGTGKMWRSAPPFGAPEVEGRWPWEEAGLLERWASLDPAGGES